ncbi:MAG: hypothetical protein C3L25_00130 [Candidatus Sedimenticola endophacoides]|uniref:Uncharacterized protein n=1 Tax=Candidatus Sedimenticola endophacoides TaxID=2548426 RepID=A0A6N4E526_9GAMM|nr:MAG: hypothetical protein B0D89_00940 [Candidatus Sedimenticola endophacoides]PUE03292.1 MAG: hypothetical protein C3L26_00605 [Candidatus Sedimenticola endophacoides]PUE05651.1 MAG: hypothetical protein C3L25_00130 [Candidatus Sedimenticola endophacoides]PUE05683.1 MAG: hypothetical protein C3L24_00615 [Candidatus Sedimenticola endophacoides]
MDFDEVIDQALLAARAVVTENWDQLEDIVAHIGEGLVSDVAFIAKKKKSGEFNEEDARVFLEDQKLLARMRLRSVAIVTLQLAERIWRAIADVFSRAINSALGWSLL